MRKIKICEKTFGTDECVTVWCTCCYYTLLKKRTYAMRTPNLCLFLHQWQDSTKPTDVSLIKKHLSTSVHPSGVFKFSNCTPTYMISVAVIMSGNINGNSVYVCISALLLTGLIYSSSGEQQKLLGETTALSFQSLLEWVEPKGKKGAACTNSQMQRSCLKQFICISFLLCVSNLRKFSSKKSVHKCWQLS